MLVEIQNNLIDLTLVSYISPIYTQQHFNDRASLSHYLIISILNKSKDVIITSKEYEINPEGIIAIGGKYPPINEEFEALHTKLVTFWKMAKKQSNIIKLD